MSDDELPQLVYTEVLKHFVETGRAPHYTDLALTLDVSTERARVALAQAAEKGFGCWMSPGTDYVGSFAPFYNLPSQYAVSIDGEPGWYAQCGLEAFAVRWLFPGNEVQVDTRDLSTAEPLRLRFRDEDILEVSPTTTVGYINTPMWKWATVEDMANL